MSMLDKLMSLKKSSTPLSPVERDAKLQAAKDFGDLAKSALNKKVGSLKKVTVASDSPEGLQKGLEKAEDLVSHKNMPENMEQEPKYCDEHSSLDEINQEIDRLLALKESKEGEEGSEESAEDPMEDLEDETV